MEITLGNKTKDCDWHMTVDYCWSLKCVWSKACKQNSYLKDILNFKQSVCYVNIIIYIPPSVSHHFMYEIHQCTESGYQMFDAYFSNRKTLLI